MSGKVLQFRRRKSLPFRYTPVPSILMDQWLDILTHNELRVALYVCRRTWAYGKEWDAIAIDQFVNGVTARNGTQVDSGCGCKRTAVKCAIRQLESRGLLLIQKRKNHPNLYAIQPIPLIDLGVVSWRPPKTTQGVGS